MPARYLGNELAIHKQAPPSTSQFAAASAVAAMMLAQRPTPVEQAMANEDDSLFFQQISKLELVINKYSDVVSSGSDNMGRTQLIYHKIGIGENEPVRQCLCRIPYEQISVLNAEVDKFNKMKAIEFLLSPFAIPTVLVRKKDGIMRLCIYYTKLNSITTKDANPLSRFEDIFDKVDLSLSLHWILLQWGIIK